MNSACMIPLVVANERGQSPNLYCVDTGDKGVFDFFRRGTLKGRPLQYRCSKNKLQFPNKTDST